ncbi:hypothetical protein D3C72_1808230 [compost metagenome]
MHTHAGTQIDGLMADARLAGKSGIGRMAIRNQQHILVHDGRQTAMQLRLRQCPHAGDEIEGLSRAVARHQDADLFMRHAAQGRVASAAACRTRHRARALLRFQHIQFVGLGNAMQAVRPVRFCQA